MNNSSNFTVAPISAGELAEEILAEANIDPLISFLGKDGGESPILEFKAIYTPIGTSEDNPDVIRWHVMKSIVAMANADGGCIIIGLDDDGTAPVQWKPNLSLASPEDKDYFEHARNFIFKNAYRTESGDVISVTDKELELLKKENYVKFHLCRSQKAPGADFLVLAVMPLLNDVIYCTLKHSECVGGKLIKETCQSKIFIRSSESARTSTLTVGDRGFAEDYDKYKAKRQPRKLSYSLTLQKYLNASSCSANDNLSLLDDILESHVDISFHSFIQTNPSDDEKRIYLSAFALVFAALGEFKATPYWSTLTKFFNQETISDTVKHLATAPRELDIHAILQVLSSDERRYAWCIDALMLGLSNGEVNEKAILVATKLCKLFGYNINELTPFLGNASKLVTSSDPKNLFEAIKALSRRTSAWKTILDFKRISLKGAFDDILKTLRESWAEGCSLSLDTVRKTMEITFTSSHLLFSTEKLDEKLDNLREKLSKITDDDFQRIANTPIEIPDDDGRTPEEKNKILSFRSEELAKFKEAKKQAEDFISRAQNLCGEANAILHVFNTTGMSISNDLYQIEPDEVISVRNESWEDHITSAYERISTTADNASDVLLKLSEQISMYENGEFDESYEEKEKREAKQRTEKDLSKKSELRHPVIHDASGDFRISLQLGKINNLPFYPADVRFAVHFSQQWFVATESKLWSTHDLNSWSEHMLPIQLDWGLKFKVLNNTLVLWNSSADAYCFTTDGITWAKGVFPSQNDNIDLIFFKGEWFLLTKERREYTYYKEKNGAEKKRTGSADTAKIYHSPKLGDEWTPDEIHSMRIGEFIDESAFAVCDDKLIAIARCDSLYRSSNYMDEHTPEAVFAYADRRWERAIVAPEDKDVFGSWTRLEITPMGLYTVGSVKILRTTDGISWKKVSDNSTRALFSSGDLIVATSHNDLLISKDGEKFSELHVDNDIDILALNGDSVLIVNTDPRTGGLFYGTFSRESLS